MLRGVGLDGLRSPCGSIFGCSLEPAFQTSVAAKSFKVEAYVIEWLEGAGVFMVSNLPRFTPGQNWRPMGAGEWCLWMPQGT